MRRRSFSPAFDRLDTRVVLSPAAEVAPAEMLAMMERMRAYAYAPTPVEPPLVMPRPEELLTPPSLPDDEFRDAIRRQSIDGLREMIEAERNAVRPEIPPYVAPGPFIPALPWYRRMWDYINPANMTWPRPSNFTS
jgi:hypothetical protein